MGSAGTSRDGEDHRGGLPRGARSRAELMRMLSRGGRLPGRDAVREPAAVAAGFATSNARRTAYLRLRRARAPGEGCARQPAIPGAGRDRAGFSRVLHRPTRSDFEISGATSRPTHCGAGAALARGLPAAVAVRGMVSVAGHEPSSSSARSQSQRRRSRASRTCEQGVSGGACERMWPGPAPELLPRTGAWSRVVEGPALRAVLAGRGAANGPRTRSRSDE